MATPPPSPLPPQTSMVAGVAVSFASVSDPTVPPLPRDIVPITTTATAVPSRVAKLHRFTSHDGAELAYRAWLPSIPTSRALILFHRGHEHSGRWQETVDRLNLQDVAIFAWDQRGH